MYLQIYLWENWHLYCVESFNPHESNSFHFGLLWFISSVFCSLQHTGTVHVFWIYICLIHNISKKSINFDFLFTPNKNIDICNTLITGAFCRLIGTFYIDSHAVCEYGEFYLFLSNLYDFYFFFLHYWTGEDFWDNVNK